MSKFKPESKLGSAELKIIRESLESSKQNLSQEEMDLLAKARAKEEKRRLEPKDYLTNTDPTNPNPRLNCSHGRAFTFYWRLIKKVQIPLFIAIALIMSGSSIDAYLIYNIKHIVDSSGGLLDPGPLNSFAVLLVFGMLLRSLFQFTSQYLFNRSNAILGNDLTQKMFKHIANMPQSFFDIHGHSTIISKIQNEVAGVTGATSGVLLTIARDGSSVVAFLIAMFSTNWVLSSVILVLIPVIYFSLKYISKAITNLSSTGLATAELRVRLLNDMVKGHQVVNLYNAQEFEHGRYKRILDFLRKMGEKNIIISNLTHSFIQFISSLLLVAIILLAAHAKQLNIPPISAGDFIVIFTSMFSLLKPIRNLTNVYTGFIGSLNATKSVLGLLALDTEEDKGTLTEKEVNFSKDVVYHDVTFSYPTRTDDKVLDKFNLTVESGKTFAFVGKSGGGKSTIVSLLPRIYNVDGGKITIDGHDIRDIKLKCLRDNISVVSQQVHLFDDTIYNNIVYCDENLYTEEEVLEAARKAHVTDFTKDLKEGIHTKIGSDGTRLSGGQRQRVSIARALLRNKPIIILDEATSALDNESEYFIQNSLAQLQEGRTVLVIAHRLSTIEKADQICVIKEGKIIERGIHDELVKNTEGEYFKLYTRNFED